MSHRANADQGAGVVVVGAGFAGIAAVGVLARAGRRVTLVDRHGYHTFQPLLYQVATAALNPGDVAFSARRLLRHASGVEFRQAALTGLRLDERVAALDDGTELAYDGLVLATGAATNFFGVPGAAEHAVGMYTLDDADRVRDRLFALLEQADRQAAGAPSPTPVRLVVVGGGATGVEMAGALAELLDAVVPRDFRHLERDATEVVLVEARDALLGAFAPQLRDYARAELARRGVRLRFDTTVRSVTATHVVVEPGGALDAGLVVWAAGVSARELPARLGLPQAGSGRVQVLPNLSLPGHPEVFAVGDVAALPARDGGTVAQLAQPAIQSGRHAAEELLRPGGPPRPFRYRDRGAMATIGRRAAVAELPARVRLTGTLAWLAWCGLHLVTLLGARNRLSVLVNWTWQYLSWRSGPNVVARD